MPNTPTTIGVSVTRRDLRDKLTGAAKYAADVQLPGMLTARYSAARTRTPGFCPLTHPPRWRCPAFMPR